MRAARLFALLDILRFNNRPLSARDLAGQTGVTERTIYRDIATLQSMGAPIRGESGLGYQLERGYFLPPLHFNKDELDAIAIGMKLAAARGDPELAMSAKQVAAKIEAIIPEADKGAIQHNQMIAWSGNQSAAYTLKDLRRAVRERRKLKLTYRDLNDNLSVRSVRPLGITAFEAIWLLTAWCENREDFRNFRVDRIEAIERLSARFAPETGKEFKDYLAAL